MFKDIFDKAQHISIYGMFSLLVFFAFFIAMTVWVVRVNKNHVAEMSRLPLDEKDGESSNS